MQQIQPQVFTQTERKRVPTQTAGQTLTAARLEGSSEPGLRLSTEMGCGECGVQERFLV